MAKSIKQVLRQGSISNCELNIMQCLKTGDLERAKTFYQEIKERGASLRDISIYFSLIYACAKERNVEMASTILEDLKRNSFVPYTIIYNTLIDCFSQIGDISRASDLINEMKSESISFDVVTYSSMIKAYARKGDLQKCVLMLEQMKSNNFSPSADVYNEIILCCCNSNAYDLALTYLNQIKSSGLKPNLKSYSPIIISAANLENNIDKANLYFQELKANTLTPDFDIYNNMIMLYAKNRNIKKASALVEEMKPLHPDAKTYSVLITLCTKLLNLKWCEIALLYLKEMKDEGIVADEDNFSIVMSTFLKLGELDSAHQSLDLMKSIGFVPTDVNIYCQFISSLLKKDQMEKALLFVNEAKENKMVIDAETYNLLISVFINKGDKAKAHHYFYEMKSHELIPSALNYSFVITSLMNEDHDTKALQLLEEMKELKLGPDLILYNKHLIKESLGFSPDKVSPATIYSHLINKYSKIDKLIDKSLIFFTALKLNKINPTRQSYNNLIAAYFRSNVQLASELLDEMKSRNLTSDTCNYVNVIYELLRQWKHKIASEHLNEMRARNVSPDTDLFNYFIFVCGQNKDFDSATACFDSVKYPNVGTYNSIIQCQGYARSEEKILLYFNQMLVKKIVPNEETYHTLITALSNCQSYENVKLYYDEMREKGFEVANQTVYGAMINACVNTQDYTKARMLFNDMKKLGFIPNTSIFNSVIFTAISENDNKLIDKYLEEMKEMKLEPSYKFIIKISLEYGKSNLAMQYFESMKAASQETEFEIFKWFIDLIVKFQDQPNLAVKYFKEMKNSVVKPDVYTYSNMIINCSNYKDDEERAKESEKYVDELLDAGLVPVPYLVSAILSSVCHEKYKVDGEEEEEDTNIDINLFRSLFFKVVKHPEFSLTQFDFTELENKLCDVFFDYEELEEFLVILESKVNESE